MIAPSLWHVFESNSSGLVASIRQVCPSMDDVSPLVHVWQNANKRLFLFYESAASAYFAFLKCSQVMKHDTVTATLRLLRLLVKHANDMQPTLQLLFQQTDPLVWQGVQPQLFARLNHPSPFVRATLVQLLQAMAAASPHALVYPAIIGAEGTIGPPAVGAADLNELNEDDEDMDGGGHVDVAEQRQQVSRMQSCCERIVATLNATDQQMVTDTKLVIEQLQRITLLREEKWLHVLTYLQHDMHKRFRQLEDEAQRAQANKNLTEAEKRSLAREKSIVFTKMTFKTLEDLYESTCADEGATANERAFVGAHATAIRQALDVYVANPDNPQQAWTFFKQLLHSFNARSSRRSSLLLDLRQISPILGGLCATRMPLPAQQIADSLILVERMASHVHILPTKTRPKKLKFIGSDGREHVYLFKGMEDLHLDERIMQMIETCNVMLSLTKQPSPPYIARHYSVTPLGSRSGLIGWVDGASTIYSLYLKWQHRQMTVKDQQKDQQSTTHHAHAAKPSEMYHKQLVPALQKKGIRDLDNRQKWPISVQRQVLQTLIDETPNDILANEIWCGSLNADVWWWLTQRFARSTAVMSVIGYVIGLGDRHLDNLLVDIRSGEVVHIDYNICFEKGRYLRVPETVPFRMTNNLKAALGPTGVEGIFRHSCEHVMSALRNGRETLLTLLEAFVYDPLVDWTVSGDQAHAIAPTLVSPNVAMMVYGTTSTNDSGVQLSVELTKRMFIVRKTELCKPWMKNKEELQTSLRQLVDLLDTLVKAQHEMRLARAREHEIGEEIALLADEEIMKIQDLSAELHQQQKRQKQLNERLNEILSSCVLNAQLVRTALSAHQHIMTSIRIVLKSLARLEESAAAETLGEDGDHRTTRRFGDYIANYKRNFIEPLAECIRNISEDTQNLIDDHDRVTHMTHTFCQVMNNLHSVYDHLLRLDEGTMTTSTADASMSLIGDVQQWPSLPGHVPSTIASPVIKKAASLTNIQPSTTKPTTAADTSAAATVHEERNVHAMNVWKRVRFKLEGRPDNELKKISVQQQVDTIIRDATDLDKLALMYEGWTAWV